MVCWAAAWISGWNFQWFHLFSSSCGILRRSLQLLQTTWLPHLVQTRGWCCNRSFQIPAGLSAKSKIHEYPPVDLVWTLAFHRKQSLQTFAARKNLRWDFLAASKPWRNSSLNTLSKHWKTFTYSTKIFKQWENVLRRKLWHRIAELFRVPHHLNNAVSETILAEIQQPDPLWDCFLCKFLI